MATIADLVVNLTANIASFRTSMDEASKSVTELADQIKETTKKVAEFLAVREVVRFAEEAASATLEWARQVEELGNRMGITAEQASTLAGTAREQGVEIGNLEGFMQRLTQRIATKPKEFAAMGIAIRDVNTGALLPMQQIARNVLSTLEDFEAGSNRDAAAAALLGKGVGDLTANLERYSATLDKTNQARMTELLHAFGLEMDESGIKKSQEWERAVNDLGIVYLGLQNIIGKAVLPIVEDFANEVIKLAENGDLQKWASAVASAFATLASIILDGISIWSQYRVAVDDVLTVLGVAAAILGGLPGIIIGGTAAILFQIDAFHGLRDAIFGASAAGQQAQKGFEDGFGVSKGAAAAGWGDATAGTRQFTAAMAGHHKQGVTLGDQFDKLLLKLQDQVRAQSLLNDAALNGTAAMKDADTEIRIQNDLRSLYNEKTHTAVSETSAYGIAISNLEKQMTALKESEAARVEIADLSAQISDAERLADAQLKGAAAVREATAANQADEEIRRLGISSTSEYAARLRELLASKNEIAATDAGNREIVTLTRQISQQEALVIAYTNSTKAGKDLAAQIDLENRIAELGIAPNSMLAAQIENLAAQELKAKDAADEAQKSAAEHDAMIKAMAGDFTKFGENVVNAFEGGKASSQSFKQQVLSDFQTLLKQLEDELLKTLVFDRIQKALESIFTGATGAGAAPGAALGTPGGGAGGLGGAGGGAAGGTGGGGALSTIVSLGSSIASKLGPMLFGGGGAGAGAASVGAGAAAGTSALPEFQAGGIVTGMHDAVPIMAHRGEMVIPANQVGRRSMSVNQQFFISTPDANSFRAAQSHIAADAHRAAMMAARRS